MSVSTRLTSCPIELVLRSYCGCRMRIVALHDVGTPHTLLRCDVTGPLVSGSFVSHNKVRAPGL
jgi:hypothetical protein